MTKQEQIKKMATTMCGFYNKGKCAFRNDEPCDKFNSQDCSYKEYAEAIYNAGYRKADEVRKETAKEILNGMLKKMYKLTGCGVPYHVRAFIKEFAEEYGVEVEE